MFDWQRSEHESSTRKASKTLIFLEFITVSAKHFGVPKEARKIPVGLASIDLFSCLHHWLLSEKILVRQVRAANKTGEANENVEFFPILELLLLSLGSVINNYVSLCFLHLSLWKGLSCIILCFHFGIKVCTATSWDRNLLILEAFFILSSASLVSSTFSRSSRFAIDVTFARPSQKEITFQPCSTGC